MFRRVNINLLAAIFTALLLIVVGIEVMDARKGNRTFKSDLVNLSADDVTTIELYPRAANGNLIKLFRESNTWKVESEGKKYLGDGSTATRLINEIDEMKTKSVAATQKERWEQFEVTDSLGTRVKFLNGTTVLADIIIGKFSFSQPRSMTSYVRLADEKEVYGVEGMLGMSFNRDMDSFRDRTIINSTRSNWTKLAFSYPSDSSFVLENRGGKWVIGEQEADSASVDKYFRGIYNLKDGSFENDQPAGSHTHMLTIEGNNGMQQVVIKGYYSGADNFILESTQNPGAYFNSKTSADKIFVSSKELMAEGQQ